MNGAVTEKFNLDVLQVKEQRLLRELDNSSLW